MTVPIYAVAIVIVLIVCFSSDFHRERPIHIMSIAMVSVVTLVICAAVSPDEHNVRYAFLTLGESLMA